MRKRRILTKKRLKALDLALSLDDVLYAKFRRMEDNFKKEVRKWNKQNQVIKVLKVGGKFPEVMQIKREIKTGEGIYLEVV